MKNILLFWWLGFIWENLISFFEKDCTFWKIILCERNLQQKKEYIEILRKYSKLELHNFNYRDINSFLSIKSYLIHSDFIFDLTFPEKNLNFQKQLLYFCEKEKEFNWLNIFLWTRKQYKNNIWKITKNTIQEPTSEYGRNKYEIEKLYLQYNKQSGKSILILRLANIYWFSHNFWNQKTFFPQFFTSIINNNKIHFDVSKNDYKDFLYIDDLCEIIIELIINKDSYNNDYNIWSGNKIFITDIISETLKYFKDIEIIFDKNLTSNSFIFDMEKVCNIINKNNFYSFKEGFKTLCYKIKKWIY